jgi:7,8-dihydro-6-hydroxymethylpterin-pyrophosphokinase
LVIPHPRILERKFVILLLKDIFGNNPVPVFSKTAGSILLETSDLSKVEIYKNTL